MCVDVGVCRCANKSIVINAKDLRLCIYILLTANLQGILFCHIKC